MLVRISSGADGIVIYQKTGRKKGREFDRDLIDERLVLEGDIDTLDAMINSIETTQPGASRYLHITLGFSERFTSAEECGPGEVNLAKLMAVADEYRRMVMAAYDPDEYCWYAEAHVPKVTHEVHATSGETIERLPHVHIVLPMRNLIDGHYLNPYGWGVANISYEQAFQEVINTQHALRSPLDVPRDQVTPPLARHKPTLDVTSPSQLRAEMTRLVATGEVQSFEQLQAVAAEHGAVKVRQGKEGDYINIQPTWSSKGINLKDFTRQGFAQQAEDLRAGSSGEVAPQDFKAKLDDWTARKAFEVRYLNSANRKHYKRLDEQGRAGWLDERIQRSRALLAHEIDEPPVFSIHDKEKNDERSHEQQRASRAVSLYQSDLSQARRQEPPGSLDRVRDLSGLDLVQHGVPAQLLLQPNASVGVGQESGPGDELRRAGAGDHGIGGPDGGGDGGGLSRPRTVAAALRMRRAAEHPTAEQLKQDTNPALVLEAAVKRFQLDPALYEISHGRDGTPRIRHADKQYNLGDFFTKHLNQPWHEAQEILKPCYYQTLSEGLPPPDKTLWKSFNAWQEKQAKMDAAAREEIRKNSGAAILAERTQYKARKAEVRQLPKAQREALMARARADQIVRIAALQNQAKEEREKKRTPPRNALYRAYLTNLAGEGNLSALTELRRLAKPETDQDNAITGRRSQVVFPQPDYRVDHTGKVTYFQSAQALVTDSVKGVAVVEASQPAYALALKVAVARYGTQLTVNGDAAFVKAMKDAAKQSGMAITIRDGSMSQPSRAGPDQER